MPSARLQPFEPRVVVRSVPVAGRAVGEPEQVTLWTQVITGMDLDDRRGVRRAQRDSRTPIYVGLLALARVTAFVAIWLLRLKH